MLARRRLRPGAGLLALLAFAPAPAQQDSPELRVEQQVRRVQIDVSVIDPRGDSRASVPNLPRDAFLVRLDGLALPPDVAARVEFDEICPASSPRQSTGARAVVESADSQRDGETPTLIVVADLNFLDLQMRHGVRKALDDLARIAETRFLRVKVIAFGRGLTPLMPDFSRDPDEIRRAGARLVEVIAAGPPRGVVAPRVNDELPAASEDSLPNLDIQFGDTEPPDPDRPRPAITIDREFAAGAADTFGLKPPQLTPLSELARREVDPRPSLAALEAVMLSHAAIRGRKALVLFSSSWFDLPEELFLSYLEGPQLAAQAGFTIWSVDARGLSDSVHSKSYSRLLGHLATSNGGEAIRSAGRLAIGFERALAQLSCYYLFNIPVEPPERGVVHRHVDVRLDTARYPEYWHYRVRSPSGFRLVDPLRQRQRRRLAALMEPQGYRFPGIRVTAAYPSEASGLETPIEVSVLLSDLTFLRDPQREDLYAELSWEGLVSGKGGRKVCTLGDGRKRVVRSSAPPLSYPPSLLVFRTSCPLPGAGLYDVRVVVEDFASGDVGAGTALLQIAEPDESVAGVSSIRLGRNSGRDFLVELPADDSLEVPRDVGRRAFGPLLPSEAISPDDRLILRFVSCKEDAPPRVVLYRQAEGGDGAASLFQLLVVPRAVLQGRGGSCREFEGIVPENSLTPGTYGLAFVEKERTIDSRKHLERLIGERAAGAFIEFKVGRPPSPTDEARPKQEARLRPDASRR
ncbi:MAG: hypothetical protein OEQ13_10925 [Acidobacteriota bacterium]|nr:hypothetical protein [Acidobacteriota bacterium]